MTELGRDLNVMLVQDEPLLADVAANVERLAATLRDAAGSNFTTALH